MPHHSAAFRPWMGLASFAFGAVALAGCGTQGIDPQPGADSSSSSSTPGSTSEPATSATPGSGSAPGSTSGGQTNDESDDSTGLVLDIPASGTMIVPGVGIGDVMLGARGNELLAVAGEPDLVLELGNLALLTYNGLAIEVLLAVPGAGEALTEASKVRSIGALASDVVEFQGPAHPNQTRDEVIAAVGDPQESVDGADFYEAGWSISYIEGAATVIAVFEPFTIQPNPPEMMPLGG